MNLAIVDDEQVRLDNGVDAASIYHINVVWAAQLDDDASAAAWETWCAKDAPSDLSIVLDLGLQPPNATQPLAWSIIGQIPISSRNVSVIDGVYAAFAAMASPRIRRLFILIASGRSGTEIAPVLDLIRERANAITAAGTKKVVVEIAADYRTLLRTDYSENIMEQLKVYWSRAFGWHADPQINNIVAGLFTGWRGGPIFETLDHDVIQKRPLDFQKVADLMFAAKITPNDACLKALFKSSDKTATITNDDCRFMTKENCESLAKTLLGPYLFTCIPNEMKFPCSPAYPFLAALRDLVLHLQQQGGMLAADANFELDSDSTCFFMRIPLIPYSGQDPISRKYYEKIKAPNPRGVCGAIHRASHARVEISLTPATPSEKGFLKIFGNIGEFAAVTFPKDEIRLSWSL